MLIYYKDLIVLSQGSAPRNISGFRPQQTDQVGRRDMRPEDLGGILMGTSRQGGINPGVALARGAEEAVSGYRPSAH